MSISARLGLSLACGFVSSFPISPVAWAQTAVPFVVRDNAAPCVNVRPRPDIAAPSLACLIPGTSVDVLDAAPFWRRVRLADGRTGWAAKKFLGAAAAPRVARDDAWLEIHVVDVGQGDGIWITTFDDNVPGNGRYEGKNIVIDGGPDTPDHRNAFLQYLARRGHADAEIDALIVTHPHEDHYAGAEGVLRHFEVRALYEPGYPKAGTKWAGFLATAAAEIFQGRPMLHYTGRALGAPEWGSELRVQFLHAYPGTRTGFGRGSTRENNASFVLKIEYGSQSILFMGDAEGKSRNDRPDTPKYVERWLLDSLGPAALKATVLKVAHHGSETSSTRPFIAAVDPAYVIVSSGRKAFNGRYLPDASTLRRYCEHNPAVRIYRTDFEDEREGRTAETDADGDHLVIRTNGTVTQVEGYSAGALQSTRRAMECT